DDRTWRKPAMRGSNMRLATSEWSPVAPIPWHLTQHPLQRHFGGRQTSRGGSSVPSPLAGEGQGEGFNANPGSSVWSRLTGPWMTPLPIPPPQGGRESRRPALRTTVAGKSARLLLSNAMAVLIAASSAAAEGAHYCTYLSRSFTTPVVLVPDPKSIAHL